MATLDRSMSTTTEQSEIEALRARVAQLEAEKSELAARANAAVAAAQDRVYWLDRWGIDLNALMRRRGAGEFRAGLRGAALGRAVRQEAQAASRRMSSRVAVVVPVKDGSRYLAELLDALSREAVDEVLVIDSGSRDDSVGIARAAGAEVLEIDPAEFGHGRTRNLGAERTSAEIVAFLTQDATPVEGWRDALLEAFGAHDDVGVVYGPHLPRADTSPMIARELVEFFATFAPHGGDPRVFAPGDPTFLSNVNAAYRRECWAELRFDDLPYSEDQAFGRAVAAHPRWRKAYAPRAGVLHAHDYPPAEFMRRYFDEYRGLRETIGHVERFGVRTTVRDVRALVAGDRRWMRERDFSRGDTMRWTGRSLVHHTGRKTFSALGSRGERPAGARSAPAVAGAPRRSRASVRRTCLRRSTFPGARTCTDTRRSRACCARGPLRYSTPCPAWPIASDSTSRSRSRSSRSAPAGTTSSSSSSSGSSAWATRARCGCTTRSASAARGRRRDAAQRGRALRADRGAAATRASTTGTAPTSRSRPAGRPCSRCSSSAASALART